MVRHIPSSAAHSSRTRPYAGVLLAAGVVGLVAGCGASSAPKAVPAGSASSTLPTAALSVAPTSAPASTPASTATATTPASPPTSTAVGPADCQSIHLALQAGQSQGAAGSTIATFILRNAGSSACGLYGFPGVSFLNSAGAQLGSSASRHGTAVTRFIVQPGQVASFLVQVAIAGCPIGSAESTTIRVFPPNQKDALEAPAAFPICTAPSVSAVKSGISQ